MKKIRVYMVLYLFPPEFTGASIQALNLAKKLRTKGIDVTFITATETEEKDIQTEYEGFPVIRISNPFKTGNLSLIVYWIKLFLILFLNRKNYDIIHCHGILTLNCVIGAYGKVLRKATLVKTTLSIEVDNLKDDQILGREAKFTKFMIGRFDRIIALSSEIFDKLILAGFNTNMVQRIPNGVDLERFHALKNEEDRLRLRKEMGLPEGIIFSYIGAIHARKRIDWMLKCWIEHYRGNKNVFLMIAGPTARENIMADGGGKEYLISLKKMVKDAGCESQVIFMPFKEEVEDYFKVSNYFINPSESEGLSNALLEAMACGVVPISSRTSGAIDLIADGENGYLFNIDDKDGLLSVLKKIDKGHEDYNGISLRARDLILNNYSLEKIYTLYCEQYNNLLGNHAYGEKS